MHFRARDSEGNILEQDYNGKCFQWLHEGQNITIERGTGRYDRFANEIFEGDVVHIHYKDPKTSTVKVKFGDYSEGVFAKGHTGFYIEDENRSTCYIGLLNAHSEIIKA